MSDNSEQQGKQRAMSIMSFGSKNRKNRRSIGPASIFEDIPTSPTKSAKKIPSYNPNPASIYGAQPDNTLTMGSIRAMQHRDANGEIISTGNANSTLRVNVADLEAADPDRSNPTRPRLERPLATIMSFHAAVEGVYGERTYSKSDPQTRRQSYYHGQNPRQRPQGDTGGFYSNRMPLRPDSSFENYASPPNQLGNPRRPNVRTNSDPVLYGNTNQVNYPSPAYSQSYDTGGSTSANESHGTDQWGNSTDPSSENSSIDRSQPALKPDLGEVYGFNGFGGAPKFQGPILEEHGQGAPTYGQPGYGNSQMVPGRAQAYQGNGHSNGPTPPPHNFSGQRTPNEPIKLGNPSAAKLSSNPSGKRRMNWIQRRLSTKGK